MSELFGDTKIGKLAEVRERAPVDIYIEKKKLQGRFHLITQQVTAGADIQIDKTFDNDILVTSFGQKLLPMQLVCIALPDNLCSGAVEGSSNVTETSLASLYRNRHAGRRNNGEVTVISVVFDGETFDGVLTTLQQVPHQLSDGINIDVFRYTLSIQGNFR